MRWNPFIIGPLMLATACGGEGETQTDSTFNEGEGSGGSASSTAMNPNTNPSTGVGDLQAASETSAAADSDTTQSGGSASAGTDDTVMETSGADDAIPDDAVPDDAVPEDENDTDMRGAGMDDSGESQPTGGGDDPAEPDASESQTDSDPDMPAQTDPEMDAMDEGAGTDADPETDVETPVQLSFATDVWPLWTRERDPVFVYRGMASYTGCSDETAPCHGATNPGAQLSMVDVETAYSQMIDTSSVSGICAGTQRVAIGDPGQSCLILFYEGRLGPMDLDWVDEAEIELMREWIRQGALP